MKNANMQKPKKRKVMKTNLQSPVFPERVRLVPVETPPGPSCGTVMTNECGLKVATTTLSSVKSVLLFPGKTKVL